jgi:hypothetical protein
MENSVERDQIGDLVIDAGIMYNVYNICNLHEAVFDNARSFVC